VRQQEVDEMQPTEMSLLETMRMSFTGAVLTGADTGYDEARMVHNGIIDKRPGVIARCVTTADVVDALNYAKAENLEIAVRAEGTTSRGRPRATAE
jgi:FAD/FMN-containing dehydrogenase